MRRNSSTSPGCQKHTLVSSLTIIKIRRPHNVWLQAFPIANGTVGQGITQNVHLPFPENEERWRELRFFEAVARMHGMEVTG